MCKANNNTEQKKKTHTESYTLAQRKHTEKNVRNGEENLRRSTSK